MVILIGVVGIYLRMECGFEFTIRGYDLKLNLVKYVVYGLYSYLATATGYFQVQ